MTERTTLLNSIAEIIADYRADELAPATPGHVEKWISQFGTPVQIALLRELNYVLRKTYFTRKYVRRFLSGLLVNSGLAGTNPGEFWKSSNFLDIQRNGNSQREMLDMFNIVLQDKYGLTTNHCGSSNSTFIYLDDVIFSGNRAGSDIEAWINDRAPERAVVHVIVIALHTSGEWLIKRRLEAAIKSSGKKIDILYWRAETVENRKYYKNDSGVLWPAELPDDSDLATYLALPHKFPFEPRTPGGKLGPFSSEQARQILEREFLLAGVKILSHCVNPKDIIRPLGYSPFGLGFGSTIVTFRNCPNNCPLAFWWGAPDADPSSPLSKWYPLFPRKTYGKEVSFNDFSF